MSTARSLVCNRTWACPPAVGHTGLQRAQTYRRAPRPLSSAPPCNFAALHRMRASRPPEGPASHPRPADCSYLRSLVVVMNKPVYYFNRGTSTPHPRMNAVIELNNSLFICFLKFCSHTSSDCDATFSVNSMKIYPSRSC